MKDAAALLMASNALLADRVRLAIMATLASSAEPVDFNTLIDALGVTKGNLSTHAQKLEAAGLIQVTKEFVGRKPRTSFSCTKLGQTELKAHLETIERLLKGGLHA